MADGPVDGMRNTMSGLSQPWSPTKKPFKPKKRHKKRRRNATRNDRAENVPPAAPPSPSQQRRASFLDYHPSCSSTAALAAGSAWPRVRDMTRGPSHVSQTFDESVERLRWHDKSLTAINLKVLTIILLLASPTFRISIIMTRRVTTSAQK